jgi:uncharacterized protein YkwD
MQLLNVLLFTLATGAVPPASSTAKMQALELLPIELNVVTQTNAHRARYGLPPLEIDMQLMDSARQHAAWMASRRSLQHTSAGVAENIAMGQGSSHEAVQDWMSSPGHRANILNGSHGRIGVGAYRSANGHIYWCQQFQW